METASLEVVVTDEIQNCLRDRLEIAKRKTRGLTGASFDTEQFEITIWEWYKGDGTKFAAKIERSGPVRDLNLSRSKNKRNDFDSFGAAAEWACRVLYHKTR